MYSIKQKLTLICFSFKRWNGQGYFLQITNKSKKNSPYTGPDKKLLLNNMHSKCFSKNHHFCHSSTKKRKGTLIMVMKMMDRLWSEYDLIYMLKKQKFTAWKTKESCVLEKQRSYCIITKQKQWLWTRQLQCQLKQQAHIKCVRSTACEHVWACPTVACCACIHLIIPWNPMKGHIFTMVQNSGFRRQ